MSHFTPLISARLAFCALVLSTDPVLAAVGATPGNFTVSDTGAASYTIALAVPPGTAGMEPKLALSYSSLGGGGLMGTGWSLSGLTAISRCGRTITQDGINAGVQLANGDRFCLDGQRLIAISGEYGADGTEYRTEIESYTKVVSHGGADGDPQYFKAWTKSGQIVEYGNADDSRIEAQGKTVAVAWAANRITDTKGNYLTFSYTEDNANTQYTLDRIDYTGNDAAGAAPYNSVRFTYADLHSEVSKYVKDTYLAGSLVKRTKALTKIESYADATLVREYRLATRMVSQAACFPAYRNAPPRAIA